MTTRVTAAQEAVTCAMLGSVILCAAASYVVLRIIEWTPLDAFMLAVGAFVGAGYVAPHLCAWWLGCRLDDIWSSQP